MVYSKKGEKYVANCLKITVGALSLGFNSWAGKIHYRVSNSSPALRHFFKAVLSCRKAAEMDPATCYTFRLDTACMMMI